MAEQLTHTGEFEYLMALKLSDELDSAGERELSKIISSNPELKKRYDRYLETRALISTGLRNDSIKPDRARPANRSFMWIAASAAALLIAVSIVFLVSKKPADSVQWSALGGKCIQENTRIKTESRVCDLQIKSDSKISVRLLPDSSIDLSNIENELRITFRGKIVADVEKTKRGIVFLSGTRSVRILGTKLILTGTEKLFSTEMIQGKAEIKDERDNGRSSIVIEDAQGVRSVSDSVPSQLEMEKFTLTPDAIWIAKRISSGMDRSLSDEQIDAAAKTSTLPGPLYIVRLKNGGIMVGTVEQIGKTYRVMTGDAILEIPSDRVESLDVP